MSDKSITIALANVQIKPADIESSYKEDKSPNLSVYRLKKLYELLNSVIRVKCDLFVLPEFSIPHAWLPEITAWSRRHQVGIVCGLEHWVIGKNAFNLLATILPYTDNNRNKHCYISLRNKNHDAPLEIELLTQSHRKVPKTICYYDLFDWRGVQFAPYLCYELADISHRGLFISELDILIACVYNKDVHYFGDIVDSLTRDIHCYVVQANSSDYGDSCILQPTKSETHDIIRVKGGENETILTAKISISKLRDFQLLKLSSTENKKRDYKHTPPNFDHEKVLKRTQSQNT